MGEYIIRRVLYGFLILVIMMVFTFAVMRAVPGDVVELMLADAGAVTEEQKQLMREQLGLAGPIWKQFIDWIGGVVKGDLGQSLWSQQPVMKLVGERLPVTIELVILSMSFALLLGIPVGVISAVKHGKWVDNLLRVCAIIGLSVPNFWLGMLIMTFLSLQFNWIPPLSYRAPWEDLSTNLTQMMLPTIALGVALSASIIRMTRSALLEVLHSDFIRTVRAKGAKESVVVFKHALRNSLVSVITLVGLQLGSLLGGTVVLESIFSLPGLGSLIYETVNNRDYPVVQACVLVFGGMFILVNMLVDIAYGWVDPRIRHR